MAPDVKGPHRPCRARASPLTISRSYSAPRRWSVGRKDDLVDIRRLEGAVGQSRPGRGQRQIGRALVIPCNSARVYACARHDPFVRGYRTTEHFITIAYLVCGKLDFK